MQRFGDRVRKARIEQGLRIPDVSEKLGYTAVHLSDIERGQRNPPSSEKVREWARLVGLDPDQMEELAKLDVESIKVPIHHDPQKAELTYAFSRRLDTMSEEKRRKLLDFILEDNDE